MPIYKISAGSISGDFWFSDEEWNSVEARAALKFEQASREEIHDTNVGLLLGFAAENNRVTTDELKSAIETLRDGGRMVVKFLADTSPAGTANHIALGRVRRHLPSEVRLNLIQPLAQLVDAANRAIEDVEQLSEPGTPGHKFTAQFENYVTRLGTVFKSAGGNPSYGTRRLPNQRDEHGSKFTDFTVHQPQWNHTRKRQLVPIH
jgi:hypothetical protein